MVARGTWLVGVFALGGAALAGGAVHAYSEALPEHASLPGTMIEGRMQPRGVPLLDWLEQERVRLLGRQVFLQLPEDTEPTTLGELGVELDVAATAEKLLEHARQGSVIERLARSRRAREGLEEVPPVFTFDPERARHTLRRLAPRVHRDPVDARLDLLAHRNVPDQPGRELDVDGSLAPIERGGREETAVFPIVTEERPAAVTSSMLAQIDVSRVLSAFDTSFKNKAGARAVNIARAAELMNGTVIAPGQTLSFNRLVGPRTPERGFVDAPVIVEDELTPGVGGGVCQAATALHAAAVYGLLDVVQRRSHSRPSGYASLGLDATVIWGEVDLKIRNPYDSPLMIHAFFPSEYVLRVELLGRQPEAEVEHSYSVVEKHDFVRRVRTNPELEPGEHKRRQKGIPGYDVVSHVRIRYPDGRTGVRRYKSKYWPVPEVFWVGPGTDLAGLPELPDGATGVEWADEGNAAESPRDDVTRFAFDAPPSG